MDAARRGCSRGRRSAITRVSFRLQRTRPTTLITGRIKESRSFSLTDHRINNYLLIKALRPNICFSRIQSRARIICLFTCPHPRKIRSPDLRRLIPPRRARRRHRDEDKLRPCYLLPLALSRELYIWGGAFAGEGRKKKKRKKKRKERMSDRVPLEARR